jgi:hypothetical protein
VNYLYFDGGPLGGMKVVTCALAGDTYISNRATYTRERKWEFGGIAVVHCYRFVAGALRCGLCGRTVSDCECYWGR